MRIILNRIWISHAPLVTQEKGSVSGQIAFDTGLKIEFDEDLLPEELEYIRDGLGDLTQRVRERVLNAIQALDEQETPTGHLGSRSEGIKPPELKPGLKPDAKKAVKATRRRKE
ncbi:MAG: hypothetical protein V7641_5026 [Blastocatellia bacterium]